VEGHIGSEAISRLGTGIKISIDGKPYDTKPCIASIIPETKYWPERNPPIRFRKNIPTSWISLALTEGKNRQVRKMTAAVGFPTLRLIRYRIEDITIEKMHAGEMKQMDRATLYKRLRLADNKRGTL
jgi:23S rRNA pseudouridine2457 synthase